MEAYGVPGKTQVTEMTFDLLKSRFDLEAREPIDVKGKGEMRNYFLLREKRSAGGS